MSGKEKDQEKPKVVFKKIGEGELGTVYIGRVSEVTGSIADAYDDLKGTFDVAQKGIVQQFNMEENISKLVELTQEQASLYREQLNEEQKKAKTERDRFYLATGVAIILGVVAIIVGFVH